MEKAHASPDQDHHHILHSSMPILKQQQQQDHLQEQEQEQEQLKTMSTEEEQEQDLNLENQPKKEQEDDMSSLHVPELPLHGSPSPSSDKSTQPRNEEEAEGGRRKEEEPTKKSDNTTVTSSSSSSSSWRGGRERLQRHRKEVAGHVWIPEIWGQEELLKDWIDCSQFDACLVPTGVVSARAALAHQAATPNSSSSPLRIDNSPSTRPAGPPS